MKYLLRKCDGEFYFTFCESKIFHNPKDYFISHSDISLQTMLRIDLLPLLCYNTHIGGHSQATVELIRIGIEALKNKQNEEKIKLLNRAFIFL